MIDNPTTRDNASDTQGPPAEESEGAPPAPAYESTAQTHRTITEDDLPRIMLAFMGGLSQGCGIYVWGVRAALKEAGITILPGKDNP